ncbi:hypothetical protein FHS10_005497 [Mucilaginibacter dorajii]|nr:hypothetical protein [Mucilaginibacter dorajii]
MTNLFSSVYFFLILAIECLNNYRFGKFDARSKLTSAQGLLEKGTLSPPAKYRRRDFVEQILRVL